MLPQYIIIGQLGLVFLIEIFVVILAWSYFKLHKQNKELQRRVGDLDKTVEGEKEKIVAQANEEKKQIITAAQSQAEGIIRDAQGFGEQSNQALAKMLDSLSEKQVEVSNQVIGRVRDDTVRLLQGLVSNLEEHASKEMSGFGEGLRREFEKARVDAQKTIDEAYGKATVEVDAYKQKRLEQIKQQMTILVREIVEKVLVKSVDDRQHEQLVMKAMEEAKKDGIL